jgi:hypothetical protein
VPSCPRGCSWPHSGSCLSDFETMPQEMITVADLSEVRQITKSRCPQSVKTRWLSRSEALHWLISHKEQWSRMNLKFFPKKRRFQFRAIITKRSFTRLEICHKIVYPFNQMKFFEQDHVTLCQVSLALKTLKGQFRDEERSQWDSNPEYATCCSTALSVIHQRRCKLLDQDLLKAAFSLTSLGCQSLSGNIAFIPIPCPLDLEYDAPCPIPNAHGPLHGI